MYLWCANCCHAHLREKWEVAGEKYGVCPTCGCSEYRNAVEWSVISQANDYEEIPNVTIPYPLQPVLF